MSSLQVGAVSSVCAEQNAQVRSDLPSLMYDDKGVVKLALKVLQESDELQRHDARVRILETNLQEMQARVNKSYGRCGFSLIAAVAISVLVPPARLLALTSGIVSGIINWEASGTEKCHWLQVEVDAEKAFAKEHPERVNDESLRKEFVYKFIFDHSPGYYLRTHGRSGSPVRWSANAHIFPEAQQKHEAIAQSMPLPHLDDDLLNHD